MENKWEQIQKICDDAWLMKPVQNPVKYRTSIFGDAEFSRVGNKGIYFDTQVFTYVHNFVLSQ
jgi:hypothetical protein